MKTGWKKGLVIGMAFCLAATSLAGCGKKKDSFDAAAEIATLDGDKVEAGLMNFFLRYQQASFESSYGSFLKTYYGDDIWNMDLTGTGEEYGSVFKTQLLEEMEKMLLAEKHASDYSVELTEEEKSAISSAAADFIAANSEEVLEKMSATQENVERVLSLYTIQQKVEEQMSADVDTEVSDEEAAQTTASYVRFYAASTDSEEDEEELIVEDEDAEDASESTGEEASEEEAAQAADGEETEDAAETATEEGSEASVTEEDAEKTGAADVAEEVSEAVEDAAEAVSEAAADVAEAVSEAAEDAAEAVSEAAADVAEAVSEAAEDAQEALSEAAEGSADALVEDETETETETEDPAVVAAREEAKERAQAFLAVAREVEDAEGFEAAAAEVTENDSNSYTTSVTFGKDDTYPDPAIISATQGLDDNTLVDEVIEVSNAYYVIYVTDAFDEEATEAEKESIVDQRKQDAVDALYDEWMDGSEFAVDEALYAELLFDVAFEPETEEETEGSEDETEDLSEVTDDAAEAVSEAAEDAAEAVSEAVADAAEAVSEAAADAAETVSEAAADAAEAVSEAAADAAEAVSEAAADAAEALSEALSE